MEKEINLFCGISSLGMPFTRDNKGNIGYYDIVKEYFQQLGYQVNGINFSSMNRNNTWNFNDLFLRNYSLFQIRNIQMMSIDQLRNTNMLFKLVVSKRYQEVLKETISQENGAELLVDLYTKARYPIFLYQAGANDFFSMVHAGPVEMLDPNIRVGIYEKLSSIILEIISNIQNNFELLIQLNSDVQIYALGTYYAPIFELIHKIITIQNSFYHINPSVDNILQFFGENYNHMLEELCNKYTNVHYVNLRFIKDYCAPFDFHPNLKGNEFIANLLIEQIGEMINDHKKYIKR